MPGSSLISPRSRYCSPRYCWSPRQRRDAPRDDDEKRIPLYCWRCGVHVLSDCVSLWFDVSYDAGFASDERNGDLFPSVRRQEGGGRRG